MSARTRPVLSHGLSYTPEYRAWQTARHRCTSTRSRAWANYGGRGIRMCAVWLDDPAAFIEHVGPRPTTRHELDRCDNDRGYEPGNVHWVLRPVNDRNRRSNRLITHAGETLPLVEWAARRNLRPETVSERLGRGWTAERALQTPARSKPPKGHGRWKLGKPCDDCGRRADLGRARCRSCENRRRPRDPSTGRMCGSAS